MSKCLKNQIVSPTISKDTNFHHRKPHQHSQLIKVCIFFYSVFLMHGFLLKMSKIHHFYTFSKTISRAESFQKMINTSEKQNNQKNAFYNSYLRFYFRLNIKKAKVRILPRGID